MNLVPWKKRERDPFEDFFNFNSPSLGLTLFPELRRSLKDFWQPAVDVAEGKNEITVKADLPGLKKEDIDVSVDGTVLTIKGERKYEDEKKEKNLHRVERAYGQFTRSIDLGERVDEAKVKAVYKDGVLEVSVPKAEASPAKRIQIEGT